MNIFKLNWKNSLLVLIFPVVLIILTVNTVSMAVNKNDSETILNQSIIDIDSYNNLILIENSKESNDFKSSITYPKVNIDKVDAEINKWIVNSEKEFYNLINENNDRKPNLLIKTDVIEVTDYIVTFIINYTDNLHKKESNSFIKTFVVDLEDEKLIESDNFKKLFNDKAYLNKLIESHLKNDKIDADKLNVLLKENTNFEWSINSTHFNLHFNKSDLSIPLYKLIDHIDASLANKLNIADLVKIEEIKKQKKLEEKKQLEKKENVKQLDPNEKYVALTFDDGPSNDVTPRVLDYLDQYNAVATFYMLGNQAKANPKVAKDVVNRGHEIGSHSYTHTDLTMLSSDKVNNEVSNAIREIEKATKVRPATFRPPYGSINQNIYDVERTFNQPIILWSIDSLDWKYPNSSTVYSNVMENMHSGAIILLHDIHPTTADALPSILNDLSNLGYKFVTVTDLLQLRGNEDVGPYSSKK